MNWYKLAMQKIETATPEQLAEAAKKMAQDKPALFVKAMGALPFTCPGQRACRMAGAGGDKIAAITECRAATGKGLKEAKDAVEGECPAWRGER